MAEAGWRELALGDVVNLKRGYDLPDAQRRDGTIPIVSSSGVTGRHDEARVVGPGVVTGRYGTIGLVHYVREAFWPLNTTLYVQDFKGNDRRFVAYLLESLNLAGLVASAAVPGINRNHLHTLPVRIPALPTQQGIASVLGAVDDLIENNRRRIENLEATARLIYREWFVHFRYPGHEDVELVSSELGPIPAGWVVATLAEVQSSDRNATTSGPFGSKLGKKDYQESPGVPVIRGANLAVGGGFVDDGFVFVSDEKAETLSSSFARPGDVVVTQRGTLGQVGLIPNTSRFSEYVLSQSQMKFTADRAIVDPLVVYLQLASDEGTDRLLRMATGAGVPHINLAMFREMNVLIPPLLLQHRLVEVLEPILELARNLINQVRALSDARILLLPRVVSGELDVSELHLDLEPMA